VVQTPRCRLKSRPSESTFAGRFAQAAAAKYAELWQSKAIEDAASQLESRGRRLIVWQHRGADVKAGNLSHIPGGYANLAEQREPEAVFFTWDLVEPGKSHGYALDGLFQVNGKWFWAPKPWRVKSE